MFLHSWWLLVLPFGRGDIVKVKLFLLPSQMHPVSIFFFFLQWGYWNFTGCWVSTKVLLYVGGCLSQCSPGASRLQLREAGAAPQATSGSVAGTKICLPIVQRMLGQDSKSRVLRCWIPQIPQRHFCSWKGPKFNCHCQVEDMLKDDLHSHLAWYIAFLKNFINSFSFHDLWNWMNFI